MTDENIKEMNQLLEKIETWIRRIIAEDDSVVSAMNVIHAKEDLIKTLIEQLND